MSKDPSDPVWVLVVRNTFLHATQQAPTMQRSRSESTISENYGSHSTDKFYDFSESDSHQLNVEAPLNDEATDLPTAVPADLPSPGSALHPSGCRPCSFFIKSACIVGATCDHCHYPHEIKNRPGKKARERDKARTMAAADQGREGGTDRDASSTKMSL